jgi:ABC-2 type transport system ATP-binding protein
VPPAAIDELAERFDASLDRPIHDLSTGNRQKIGLIQALMHRPELLILDEPISGLDPLVQRNFHELLREVRAEGRTVFLSSHTLSEVDRVADRVAILRRGRLIVVDRLANLRALAVRRLDIEFAHPPDPAEFQAIPGVRTAEATGALLHVSLEGSADALVKAAAAHEVLSIRSREDELEDIFLRYYQEDAG